MNHPQDEMKYLRQLKLEREMVDAGADAFHAAMANAKEKKRENSTPYGVTMLASAVAPVGEAIQSYIDRANSGEPGRRHAAVKYLNKLPTEVTAYLALRVVIESITRRHLLQNVAFRIAEMLEDEVNYRIMSKAAGGLYNVVKKRFNTADYRHKRKVMLLAGHRAEIELEEWPQRDRLHLGTLLIDLIREHTGFVEKYTIVQSKNRTPAYLKPTDEIMEYIEKQLDRCALMHPIWQPTIIPPKPWDGPFDGGYHNDDLLPVAKLTFVKKARQNYLEELDHRKDDMHMVYEAVNAIQGTPWRINTRVLDVLKEVWDQGIAVGKLPARFYDELPPRPHDIDTNKDSRRVWRRAASRVHERNNKNKSKRIQAMSVIQLGDKFRDEKEIFFPHCLDFRGRIYAMPQVLSPQGVDHAKAVLEFSEGKPLGTLHAARWLAIHGAGLWGYDKVSLDDRIDWVMEHKDRIKATAEDPLGNLQWWSEADKPWQFLGWCFEWAGYLAEPGDGLTFESRIPISMDGSNNGLQNFAAMLRDPVSGEAVNLVPKEVPADIYQRVADVVMDKVGQDLTSADETDQLHASWWSQLPINRKLTKRPVMVLPYGGTPISARKYIDEYLDEAGLRGNKLPWSEEDHQQALTYITRLVWDAIGEVVVAAREAMGWLQKAARLAAAEGMPVVWTTPLGFPVVQAYPETKSRRVDTKLAGSVLKLSMSEETDRLDKNKQRNGVSPNFVHSMDATHLCLSVVFAMDMGVKGFAMIHDSYGTHAADADTLAAALRDAFIHLYTENDVLEDFRNSIAELLPEGNLKNLPPIPDKGTLDLEQVRYSSFFFC